MLLVFFPFSAYNQKSLMPTVILCLPIDFVINIVILSNVSTKSFFMYWSWTFSSLSDHYLSNLNIRLLFCTQRPIAIEQNGNIMHHTLLPHFCRAYSGFLLGLALRLILTETNTLNTWTVYGQNEESRFCWSPVWFLGVVYFKM